MRGRVECRACGHTWTTTLTVFDDGRRHTYNRRCCDRCHIWKTLSIVEVLPPPPPVPPPDVCVVEGCITRLHSWAVSEGRTRCYVHEREAVERELAAEAEALAAREAALAYAEAAKAATEAEERRAAARRRYHERPAPPCVDCGKPRKGGRMRNQRCLQCASAYRWAGWTEEACVAALQRFQREYGRTPTVAEHGRDSAEDRVPWLPSIHTLKRLYGSRAAGYEAAGLEVRPVGVTTRRAA